MSTRLYALRNSTDQLVLSYLYIFCLTSEKPLRKSINLVHWTIGDYRNRKYTVVRVEIAELDRFFVKCDFLVTENFDFQSEMAEFRMSEIPGSFGKLEKAGNSRFFKHESAASCGAISV